VQVVFVSHTFLLEQSHVNKSDEVSLKACCIYYLYRTGRQSKGKVVQKGNVDIVEQYRKEEEHVETDPINYVFEPASVFFG
jgi:hypothetical protein